MKTENQKRIRHCLFFVPFVVMLLLAVGCASGRAQLRTATDTYATTLIVLTEYRQAGLIDDQEVAEIERWRVVARAALDAWREAIETFNRAMQGLAEAKLQVEGDQ